MGRQANLNLITIINMKRQHIFLTVIFIALSFACCINSLSAQKLPKVQQVSLHAPANVKIDGKATEWGNQFEAFNPTSRVFYTLANDKENLYLVARMEDKYGNQKAIIGGITLTINPKSKNKIAVTFPIAEGRKKDIVSDLAYRADQYTNDPKKLDSLIEVVNKTIVTSFNQIGVSGIKEINDPTISIYNNQGVKAASRIDAQMKYVFEAALSLKYLENLIDGDGKIQYNIKIDGTIQSGPGQGTLVITNSATNLFITPDALYKMYPTDLSGGYTLAK